MMTDERDAPEGNQQLNAIYFAKYGDFPDKYVPEKKLLEAVLG